MKSETIDAIFRSHPKESRGRVHLASLTQSERTSRSIRRLATCWGLAVLTIPIPPHIIIAPSFLTAGVVLAFLAYNAETLITGGEGTCPNCEAPFEVVKGALKWPYSDTCSKCYARVLIEPIA